MLLNSKTKFNIAYIKMTTKIEGPFNRCCIWFQGCNINCKGCCNIELQALKPKNIVTLDELVDIVNEAKDKYNIEGVTLSGGEPTLQKNLHLFTNEIKKLGLGIIMFSGQNIKNINKQLIDSVDLVIDGPFIEEKKDDERLLIGSTNKRLIFITDRYKNHENYFYNNNSIEEVVVDDYIFFNGD